ncbi:MAG: hypothetical protein ACP5O3_01125 [Candidatus Micrarchaeia archaeon]
MCFRGENVLKAAILSFDALLALAVAAIAFGSVVSFSSLGADNSKNAQLNALAWDFLHDKYGLNLTVSADDFHNLTGRHVFESPPSTAPAGHALYYKYNNLCGCGQSCYLENEINTSCLEAQDNNSKYEFEAWVTP